MSGWGPVLSELPRYLAAHVELTLLALAIALAVSVPLGVLASRRPRLGAAALGVASVLQTIPGLALLALMVPLLGGVGLALGSFGLPAPPSIGFLPALIALSLYGLLPMLRNTVTGLDGVDPALVEAARGVGMSSWERLRLVELPLAMPTIVAGIRTATVWVVGTATLATPVGGTSLGNPIFAGLQTRNLSAVLAGSLAAAGLALLLDALIRAIEQGFAQRDPARRYGGLLGLLWVAGFAVLSGGSSGGSMPAGSEIRIGAKSFTEQYVLSEILGDVVARDGRHVGRVIPSLGSTVAFDALRSGELDLYVDYSGTIWATILGRETQGASREEVLAEVEARLLEDHGIVVLARLGFENTYCLAMRGEDARAAGLRRISELAARATELEILGDYEFFERPEWRALVDRYGLRFGSRRAMDASLMYEALRSGNGDVISAYSTDGRIAAYGLSVLADDRGVIPPYDAIVLASAELVDRVPEVAEAVAALSGRIDAEAMRSLNAAVDLEGEQPAAVAAAWVRDCLDPDPARAMAPRCGATDAATP